ncbi:MAG: DUF3006 domain-containing protein [Armatimonadota bacterium]
MKVFIDRIEGDIAVLLLGDTGEVVANVPVFWLPKGVKEGIYLKAEFQIDMETTERACAEVQALMDSMGNEP